MTLLLSRGRKPLGVVHSGRTITGTELKAVRVQFDGRCRGTDCCPGRPDPLVPLVPHHVRLHSVHRMTSIDETLLVCERLHQDLHVGKRTIRLRDGRLVNEEGYLTPSGAMLWHMEQGPDGGWAPVPGIAPEEVTAPASRIECAGEVFEVRADQYGGTHYTWLTGPNPGYGFSVSPTPDDIEQHRTNIRSFLSMIDPTTGHVADA